jgi:signal transduction histidine kinase
MDGDAMDISDSSPALAVGSDATHGIASHRSDDPVADLRVHTASARPTTPTHEFAGVGHDLNNFLQVVGNSLDLLARRHPSDARVTRWTDVAQHALLRARKLSRQLVAPTLGDEGALEAHSPSSLESGLHELIRRALPDDVALEFHCATGLRACMMDVPQFESALLNLAINARDAMPYGGRLIVTFCNVVVDEASAAGHGARPSTYVATSMRDTGIGMPPEVAARAFEPCFTTKLGGSGTGLGLARVAAFAKRCKGFTTIQSELNVGTVVTIFLPRADLA